MEKEQEKEDFLQEYNALYKAFFFFKILRWKWIPGIIVTTASDQFSSW